MLYIFSGLPGTGKTTLARRLSTRIGAIYLRIDTIEQGLRDLCGIRVEGEGYRLSYRIARDNLLLGMDVIADACNPIELTRREWEQTALDAGTGFVNIEVVCSDRGEHRRRINTRKTSIPGFVLPDWAAVAAREYHPWTRPRIVIDTAGQGRRENFAALMSALEQA